MPNLESDTTEQFCPPAPLNLHIESKFGLISLYCINFHNIMSKHQCYTLREVSAEVFVDEDNDFDLDIADSLSYSSEQVCKTGQQDNVEMRDIFQTLFDAENIVVTPHKFLSSSFPSCRKMLNERCVLKIEHSVACVFCIVCAKIGWLYLLQK